MADDNTGALSAVAEQGQDPDPGSALPVASRPGGIGALSAMAYGVGGGPSLSMDNVNSVVDKFLPPAKDDAMANQAYWAGTTDPTNNPSQFLATGAGNGLKAQLGMQNERDKLRAAYVPLVTQAMIQNQQMTLAAAKATRDWKHEIATAYPSHMAGLRMNGATPTYQQTLQHVANFAQMHGLDSDTFNQYASQVPKDDAARMQYLDGQIAMTDPKSLLPTTGKDASGRLIAQSGPAGTVRPLTPVSPGGVQGGAGAPPAAGPGGAGATAPGGAPGAMGGPAAPGGNPTDAQVAWEKSAMGDPAKYEDSLKGEADAWDQALARLNKGQEFMTQFNPGKYAGMANGLGAMIQSLGSYLPGTDPDKVKALAQKFMNAPPGSENAVAAKQAFDAMMAQEAVNQLKATENGDGSHPRFTNAEIKVFNLTGANSSMTPEAVRMLTQTAAQRAAEAANKYSAWGKYKSTATNPSVGAFDIPYETERIKHRLTGSNVPFGSDQPGNLGAGPLPGQSPGAPASPSGGGQPGAQAPGSGAVNARGTPQPLADPRQLTLYEKGAILSKRGVPIVADKNSPNGFRYAKKVQ